jgi:tetratricopeptide (TPR) repeat protein
VTENGRVSYAKTIRARNSAVACSDATSPASSKEELVKQAQELVLKEFRKDVAPYFVSVEAPVMNSSEGIPSGEGRDFFIQGLLAAEENRPDRACALWEKSAKFTSTSPGLQYDLGICRELAGELEAALEEYQKAEILLKGPNETVSTALDRVKKEIAARNKVSGDASR